MRLKIIGSFLLTGIIFYFISGYIDVKSAFYSLRIENKSSLIIVFLSYFLMYILISARWKMLLGELCSFRDIFYVTCVHNLFNNIMPLRTGEASFLYVLKKTFSVPALKSTSFLFYARMLDVLAMLLLFFVSALLYQGAAVQNLPDLKAIIAVVVISFLFLYIIIYLIFKLNIFAKVSGYTKNIGKEYFFSGALEKISGIVKEIEERNNFYRIIAVSFLILLMKYIFLQSVASVFGVELNIFETVISGTLVLMVAILPVQGIAGFGTLEAGWGLGLYLIGVGKEAALMTGFGFHLFQIALYSGFGIIGIIRLRLKKETIREII